MDNNLFDSMLTLANENVNAAVNMQVYDDKYESINRVALNSMKELVEIEKLNDTETRGERDLDLRTKEFESRAKLEATKHSDDVKLRDKQLAIDAEEVANNKKCKEKELFIKEKEIDIKAQDSAAELEIRKLELEAKKERDDEEMDIKSHELDIKERETEIRDKEADNDFIIRKLEAETRAKEVEYRHQERMMEHEEKIAQAELDSYIKKMETITRFALIGTSVAVAIGTGIVVPIVVERNHTRKWEATMITEANDVIVNKNSLNIAKENPRVKSENLINKIF